MKVYTADRKVIYIADESLASGGEGEVRIITSAQGNAFSHHCVKLYYKNKRTEELRTKIEYMIKNPPAIITSEAFIICWPEAVIFSEEGDFLGFVMPLAFEDSQSLVTLTTPKISKKVPEEWHTKFGPENGRYAVINRLKLINNLLLPIYNLHKTEKYVMQDFKPENVLVNHTGRVSMLDMDSIQIYHGDVRLKGGAATPEYIPPEFYTGAKGEMLKSSWDMFAVGVVFYKLLLGIHPYAVIPINADEDDNVGIPYNIQHNLFAFGENSMEVNYAPPHERFKNLPPAVKKLFQQSFRNDPDSRPSAENWLRVLKNILGDIKKAGDVNPPPPIEPVHIEDSTSPLPPIDNTDDRSDKFILTVIIIALIVAVVAVVVLVSMM